MNFYIERNNINKKLMYFDKEYAVFTDIEGQYDNIPLKIND